MTKTNEGWIRKLTRAKHAGEQKDFSSKEDFLPKELEIEVSSHRSPSRYGLSFHPAPLGLDWTLHLKVPRGTSREKIREILYRHRRWINSRFNQFRQGVTLSLGSCSNDSEGEKRPIILFDGIFHKIIIEKKHPDPDGEKILVNPDKTIVIRSHRDLSDSEAVSALRELFLRVMIQRTLGILEKRSHQMNLYPKRVVIRNTKRQWGSMNRHGIMSLSLRLAQMNEEILDLVIVHELCHMLHPNHGASFNTILSELTPEHRRKMKEISAIPLSGHDSLWESGFSSLAISENLLPKSRNNHQT